MKKKQTIFAALLIVVMAICTSCGTERYGCPKARQGNWHGRQNMTVHVSIYPDCVASREGK